MKDILEMGSELFGLRDRTAGKRPGGHDAFQRFGECGADQPDALSGDQLQVVATAAKNPWILVRARDAGAPCCWFTYSSTLS